MAGNSNNLNLAQESCISDPDQLQAPEARFECPICLAWLRDPMQTSCGHRFCRKCIQSWLEREKACPVDNKPLDKDNDIFPDNFTRREISQQRLKCPNIIRGCSEDLSPLDVEAHLLTCKYGVPKLPDNEKLRCSFVAFGCDSKFEDEPEQQRHLEQETQKHLMLLSQAYSKLILNNSASTSSAAIAEQANFWDPPSKNDSNAMQISSNSNESVHNLLRSLYEKIVVLEQKNREQDIIMANMSEQIASLNLTVSKLSLRYCNGCYLWSITDFKNKINQMRVNHQIMHYSPGFYTSTYGYKLCIRFNLSPKDPTYVAILIHMMKSEHDNSLEWPFTGRISVTIVHPLDSFQNMRETMMTRPELEAFKRPVQDLNPRGFGYTEFVLIEDLFAQGFIDNNNLVIKVNAQPV
ncbi:hypothetical protein RN001_003241 [Aquatica leii]|uniref:TNF receptor-associated factor 6 n=1 Tax=Aquatica leii TaxID=1421715 RepID=A0AAN7QBJ7_9COLE|nr:hypothetical protein RN001_003241 [Aquatica leii]